MNNFEIMAPEKKAATVESKEDPMKEVIFRQIIETGITNSLFEKFASVGFSEDEIIELRKKMLALSEHEREWIESLPYELRQRQIPFLYKKFKEGSLSMDQVLEKMMESGKKLNRRFGYHCSEKDIRPTEMIDGLGQKIETWNIAGTEKDHRNSDLPMAYYSEDYYHLYMVKNPRYLYVISSNQSTGSGHYRDNSQSWGRANNLSVIQRFDLAEIRAKVEGQYKEYLEETKNAAN